MLLSSSKNIFKLILIPIHYEFIGTFLEASTAEKMNQLS